ncbi:MAG: hypothetical protein ACXW2U_20040, partial [Telluria sp.]
MADMRSSPARLQSWSLPGLDRARLETIARAAIFVVVGAVAAVAAAVSPLALLVGGFGLVTVWLLAWRD